jgi:di/tripeptidase
MNITLIQGEFNAKDAIEIITQMLQIKIKYHEDKIGAHSNEEDIKTREAKIKRLQHDLSELRKTINSRGNQVNIEAVVEIEYK